MTKISNALASQMAFAQRRNATNSEPQRPMSDEGMKIQARKSAVDFEGMTLGELLQPMFDTIDTSKSLFGGGTAESQFRSLQVLELGKQIAQQGGVGLSETIYRQMLTMMQEKNHQKTS